MTMARCITCAAMGHDVPVNEDQAKEQGLTSSHEGKTCYFHKADEKQKFDQNPDHFVQMAQQKGFGETCS